MSTEAPILTQENLDFLSTKLVRAVPVSRRKGLDEWIGFRQDAQSVIESKVRDFAGQVEGFVAAISEVEARYSKAQGDLGVVRERLGRRYRSSVWGVVEGIRRQVLANPDFRPPFILAPIKLLAKRKPHPEIASAEQRLDAAGQELKKANERAQRQTDCLGIQEFPKIDAEYTTIGRAEDNILATYRRAAVVVGDEGLKTFVQTVPWQAEQIAVLYAQEKAGDAEVLTGYQDFVEFMHDRFRYPAQASEHRMTPESYREISDTRVINCWKAFVGYRKLMELAELGLIPQPAIPEVIDIAGPNIKDFVPVSKKPGITQ